MIKLRTLYILLALIIGINAAAQDASPEYYLVDSLPLEKLTQEDKRLIDSCLAIYHSAKSDTTRLLAISAIAEGSWDERVWPKYNALVYEKVNQSLEREMTEEERRQLLTIKAGAVNNLGFIEHSHGNLLAALKRMKEALAILEKLEDQQGMGYAYNNLGATYESQGDIAQSLKYYQKSIEVREQIGDQVGVATVYNNIGVLQQAQGNGKLAEEYYTKALEAYQAADHEIGVATTLNNLATFYRKEKQFEKAVDYYYQALEMREKLEEHAGIASCFFNLGVTYGAMKEVQKALNYHKKSLAIRHTLADKIGLAKSYHEIGQLYYEMNNVEQARLYADSGLDYAYRARYPVALELNADLLYQLARERGDYKTALEMRNLQIQMRDSIQSEENIKAVTRQQSQYEYDKQKALDQAAYEKEKAIQRLAYEQQVSRRNMLIVSFAIGALLLAVFLYIIYKRLTITRRQKQIIERVKAQVEEKNREINASITYAKRIQKAVLPEIKMTDLFADSFLIYKPKDVVSGDFYWWEKRDNRILFAVADCTGHGVPGGFMSMLGSILLNEIFNSKQMMQPAVILDELSRLMQISLRNEFGKTIKDGMDISFAMLDTKTLELHWAGANNPLYVLRNETGEFEIIKGDRQPIGYAEHAVAFSEHRVQLQKGDCVYLFSDGYADQFGGPGGKKLGYKAFRNIISSTVSATMKAQGVQLDTYFEQWKASEEQVDDVCLLGIKV